MFPKVYYACILRIPQRRFHFASQKLSLKRLIDYKPLENDKTLTNLIKKYESRIVYNSFISNLKPTYRKAVKIKLEDKNEALKAQSIQPLPVVLKYLMETEKQQPVVVQEEETEAQHVHFPYGIEGAASMSRSETNSTITDEHLESFADSVSKEVKHRHEHIKNWMTDYENYTEPLSDDETSWQSNYGTPNRRIPVSNVPCGGCGALLHCQDPSIPGYIPSEIFKNSRRREGVHLKALTCQRCHFLKHYDIALQVRVSGEDYPEVLQAIRHKSGLVVLLVDLLDFPCSIWPGITDMLGGNKSIILVGNKVDLLPRDSRGYLRRITDTLKETAIGVLGEEASRNIKHLALISAKTGWGVEELITKLHNLRQIRGDVYIVGCTNVGKSSLFNALLQSDYCRVQAVDLIQRATTSVWPGTTLNLLKFPILRPSDWKMYVRTKRLMHMRKLQAAEERLNRMQLRETGNLKYATLIGHIDRTFMPEVPEMTAEDVFSVKGSSHSSGKVYMGLDENDPMYAATKWCYDTPGVVRPDQIIHLLTTEELMSTLPKQLIRPKTFGLRLNQTIFIAGLARLDYIEGPYSIRLTVFCSDELPVTICNTEDADGLYSEFLGTDVLRVPRGAEERLAKWPGLKAGDKIQVDGIDGNTSGGDIVLSNAGWVAVSGNRDDRMVFSPWTPDALGIYSRKSLLPNAVALRGQKQRSSPAYDCDKIFIPK